jgi:two-component sensor histidine kinase
MLLGPDKSQSIAIILHELATNAAKYGSLSETKGRLDLTWRYKDGSLVIRWKETGGPTVKAPARQGFGSRVIQQMVGQLAGDVQFEWNPAGLICQITFVS